MSEAPLRYLSVLDVLAMHQEIMARYNQDASTRDKGEALLESAMMRPKMAAYYEGADLAKQTALLIVGIAQAYPFMDGNKRVAFGAGIVFLQLNGYLVKSRPREFGERVVGVLTGAAVDDLADWIRANLELLTA